jgi:hypothetical protein
MTLPVSNQLLLLMNCFVIVLEFLEMILLKIDTKKRGNVHALSYSTGFLPLPEGKAS